MTTQQQTRPEGKPWTLAEAAEFLEVSQKTLTNRIKSNDVKAFRLGPEWRIPDDEVRRISTAGY